MQILERRVPEMETVGPVWWNIHGMKMMVESLNKSPDSAELLIQGSAAKVKITRSQDKYGGWYVGWRVQCSMDTWAGGRTWMSDDDLRSAFALSDLNGNGGGWIIQRFGGTSAAQRKFIRYENYLNIPGPGTGHDGDPNVSIEIDEKMKNAVAALLE